MKHFTLILIFCAASSILPAQTQIAVDLASSTPTSASPGIVFGWPQYTTQNMLYNGNYINLYGMGFHGYNDGTSVGGVNAYMSSYFGLDFFTGAQRRFRINANGSAIIDQSLGIGGMPVAKLDVGNFVNGSQSNEVVLRLRNTISQNSANGWGSAIEFFNMSNNNITNGLSGAKIISEASDYGWASNLKFRVVSNNGYSTQTALDALTIVSNGNVGIGTNSPDSRLSVNGTIHSKEVKVDMTGWPDYVFEKDYTLPALDSMKSYIDQNKHLPEVPSAEEVEANGVNLGEMSRILLKKVEELTLYMIDQNKKIEFQQHQNDEQQRQIGELKLQMENNK